ncbi:hypothetical protein G7048_25880 (plasmid) [Diaphorobacter sp. HDW4B]|uniref:sulfotransferase n=1 Tax=Diaphorobacter sp. HDW4B TaxID=2714925 RepID=UPI00140E22E6|nr:sulfotransferase [Diaphorobacter sp. HDW4B]QIL73928.1 hypothetical protein G7048_25880 [Diaphorobacter sp. HDW4B]
MRLPKAFVRLPWQFDAARLAAACAEFSEADWRAHPQNHAGNTALSLVAVHGNPQDDGVAGPMTATPLLERSPYLQEVLASFDTPVGRTRLMRLAPGADATPHVDIHYYWQQRMRIHVPVLTTPDVRFECGDAQVHMAPGESWVFDTWRLHNVLNPTDKERIHLVVDTVGSASLWDAVAGQAPRNAPPQSATPMLRFERTNIPIVMSPWELDALWADWLADACGSPQGPESALAINELLQPTLRDWRALWAEHGDQPSGWNDFLQLRDRISALGHSLKGKLTLPNGVDLGRLLQVGLVPVLCQPPEAELTKLKTVTHSTPSVVPTSMSRLRGSERIQHTVSDTDRLRRPVIIVGAPRSGSTLLFETLAHCLPVHTVQGESHQQIERFQELRPQSRNHASNRLVHEDAQGAIADALRRAFLDSLRDRAGLPPPAGQHEVRWLEKTPKNALRVPFLDAVFPEACFVYLLREPRANIGSLMDAWQSGRFVTYPGLPGWSGPAWSFLLIEGWRQLIGSPLAHIAAAQWSQANSTLLEDLAALPASRVYALEYESFVQDPQKHVAAIARFAGLDCDQPVPSPLPLARHTLTPPITGKWRRHADALEDLWPALMPLEARARQFVHDCQALHLAGFKP